MINHAKGKRKTTQKETKSGGQNHDPPSDHYSETARPGRTVVSLWRECMQPPRCWWSKLKGAGGRQIIRGDWPRKKKEKEKEKKKEEKRENVSSTKHSIMPGHVAAFKCMMIEDSMD